MKIYHESRHVKTVPAKYGVLASLGNRFKDCDRKRLSRKERFLLEVDLFVYNLNTAHKELVNGLKVTHCEEVRTNDRKIYYVAVFGGYKLKVPHRIYHLCDDRRSSVKTI